MIVQATRPDPWLIRCWREVKGLSQGDVNEAMGCPRVYSHLSRIENYAQECGEERLALLAVAIGVPVNELCSTPEDRMRFAGVFLQWCKDGRPELQRWLRTWRVT